MPPDDQTDWAAYALEQHGITFTSFDVQCVRDAEHDDGYDAARRYADAMCRRRQAENAPAKPRKRRPSFRAPQSEAGRVTDKDIGRMRREVGRDRRLTDRERAIVLDVFGKIQETTGKACPNMSVRDIARRLRISRHPAHQALTRLLELGILERQPYTRAKYDGKGRYNAPRYRYVPAAER